MFGPFPKLDSGDELGDWILGVFWGTTGNHKRGIANVYNITPGLHKSASCSYFQAFNYAELSDHDDKGRGIS